MASLLRSHTANKPFFKEINFNITVKADNVVLSTPAATTMLPGSNVENGFIKSIVRYLEA
jgi:hypothetical protein